MASGSSFHWEILYPQREAFVSLLKEALKTYESPPAYYTGAADRAAKHKGSSQTEITLMPNLPLRGPSECRIVGTQTRSFPKGHSGLFHRGHVFK